jgi:choice-of-anchor B domain-containing protein
MSQRSLKSICFVLCTAVFVVNSPQLSAAIDCDTLPPPTPVTIDSINTFTFSGFGGSDCWGWEDPDGTEYAIMGVAAGVAFVNVTTMQVVQTVPGPTSGCGSIRWRDMETYRNYCYCVSECSGTNGGMMIIDMQYLPDSVHLVGTYPTGTSHNMFVDTAAGFAYVLRSDATGFRVLDLADPENPVAYPDVSTFDIHDLYARNDTVWVAEGWRGSWSMWDMSNKNSGQLITRVSVPAAGYVHNVWPTADGRYAVTTEETAFKTIKVWNTQNPASVSLTSQFLAPSQLAHNVHVIGDYVVTSHYESGVQITDISEPECPAEVGLFDTWTSSEGPGYGGCWGAYPYTSSGNIYASNGDGRLFILNAKLSLVGFGASPVVGQAPLTVDFVDTSPKASSSWDWDFGDGDSSTDEAPSHTYTDGGLYDVELTVTNDNGTESQLKRNFITVLAETLSVADTALEPDVQDYWDVQARNTVPIGEFTLPVSITNVPSVLFLDSIVTTGTRAGHFELSEVLFDNRFNGQLAIRFTADAGGGAPPLLPGDGPVARVWFRTRHTATAGQTATLSLGTLGSYDFSATTVTTDFEPAFSGGTITIVQPPCDCVAHGDVKDDGSFDVFDLNVMIDYLFASGIQPPQDPLCPHEDRGDLNCDGATDSLDLAYLIALLFEDGPAPCDPCACNQYPDDCA